MLGKYLVQVKTGAPLIHSITNYVTVNDCANILLACGASPIMADDALEAEDITAICGGLVINIGTLNQHTISSMFLAGTKANELGHPTVLDPVGIGASNLRTRTAIDLIDEVKFSVIRGNISEIKALASGSNGARGVDADILDAISEETIDSVVSMAKSLSLKTGAVIVITGAIDIAATPERVYIIRNGHPLMSRITGSGCMLSCLIGAYITANPGNTLDAAAAATAAMGLCGEKAAGKLTSYEGNASFCRHLIDEMYLLGCEDLDAGAKFDYI